MLQHKLMVWKETVKVIYMVCCGILSDANKAGGTKGGGG